MSDKIGQLCVMKKSVFLDIEVQSGKHYNLFYMCFCAAEICSWPGATEMHHSGSVLNACLDSCMESTGLWTVRSVYAL